MLFEKRLRNGLTKRLIAYGIYEPVAGIFATASYPMAGYPKSKVSPKRAGQILESIIGSPDGVHLLARLQDPEGHAARMTEYLSRELYGTSARKLVNHVFGEDAADLLGF